MRALQQSLRVLSRGLATTVTRRSGVPMREPATGLGIVPPNEGYKKVMQHQVKLAEAKEEYVWKKNGTMDMAFYNGTMVFTLLCTLFCCISVWNLSWPEKKAEE